MLFHLRNDTNGFSRSVNVGRGVDVIRCGHTLVQSKNPLASELGQA